MSLRGAQRHAAIIAQVAAASTQAIKGDLGTLKPATLISLAMTIIFSYDDKKIAQNGITFQRSTVTIAQVTDGTSNTFMVGEKYLNPDRYYDGKDVGDDQNAFVGHDRDLNGYADRAPRQDRPGVSGDYVFGSVHNAIFYMAYCDGSVRSIDYDVDPRAFRTLAGRNDGAP